MYQDAQLPCIVEFDDEKDSDDDWSGFGPTPIGFMHNMDTESEQESETRKSHNEISIIGPFSFITT